MNHAEAGHGPREDSNDSKWDPRVGGALALDDGEELYEVVDGKRVTKTSAVLVDDSEILYEVVDGKRVELPPMGAHECHLAMHLAGVLWSFSQTQRLGRVETEMLFLLDASTDLTRRPDVAFVSYERWPRARPVPRTASWQVVPNLAVEVVSPTNTAPEVLRKVAQIFPDRSSACLGRLPR